MAETFPSRREVKYRHRPWARAAAAGTKSVTRAATAVRPAVVVAGCLVAVGLMATAVIQRDVAGAFAVAGAVFLAALALDILGVRRRVPGARSAGPIGTVMTLGAYTLVIGLAYGVVAQVAPGPGQLGGGTAGVKDPKTAGVSEPNPSRPSLSVVGSEEPSFMATVVRVLAPTTIVLDGNETVDLAGVPGLGPADPAYEPALGALEDLVVGRVVTVQARQPWPDATTPRRLEATVTVPTGQGRPVIVNEVILRLIESARRLAP